MLRFALNRGTEVQLFKRQKQPFSIFKAIMHYVRTAMNRVRWEENQQFTSLQERGSTVPKNVEQATQLFIATEQQVSLSEKDRMKRIDMVTINLGRFWAQIRIFMMGLSSKNELILIT